MIAALILADGRFPAGGHAHSGGMEAAVAAGKVADFAGVEAYLIGRLHTAGLTAAALSAASCSGNHPWEQLDVEADARTPSPALRSASRRQGRQLMRAASALWPGTTLEGLAAAAPAEGPHHAVALGAAGAAAGLGTLDAARSACYQAVAGPAAAAIKLLGLDPLSIHVMLAGMAPQMEAVASAAAGYAKGPLERLPCAGTPLLDLHAERHACMELRLFAS
ncbi:MAG: urease accessory protein UreF [Actinomycetota bacterium]